MNEHQIKELNRGAFWIGFFVATIILFFVAFIIGVIIIL